MKIKYAKSFLKDIEKLAGQQNVSENVLNIISILKEAQSLVEVANVKAIQGYASYYRIRIGNHRIGLKKTEEEIELIRCLHRKDIYRMFP
ncbi:mRNA interferase RelE/StbE [Desulfonatronum zhilinae]|nr:mRNA interferase RelE/StbE [Desulfonatronum zhilinae]